MNINDHGCPVGRLSSVEQSLEECRQAHQAVGLLAWNGQKLRAVTPSATNHGERQVSDLLIEMRE